MTKKELIDHLEENYIKDDSQIVFVLKDSPLHPRPVYLTPVRYSEGSESPDAYGIWTVFIDVSILKDKYQIAREARKKILEEYEKKNKELEEENERKSMELSRPRSSRFNKKRIRHILCRMFSNRSKA